MKIEKVQKRFKRLIDSASFIERAITDVCTVQIIYNFPQSINLTTADYFKGFLPHGHYYVDSEVDVGYMCKSNNYWLLLFKRTQISEQEAVMASTLPKLLFVFLKVVTNETVIRINDSDLKRIAQDNTIQRVK